LQARGTGRSRTSRDRAGLVVLVRDRDLAVGRAAPDLPPRDLVVLGGLVRDRDLAVARVDPDLARRDLADLAPRDRADLARRGKDPPDRGRAGQDLAARVDPDLALQDLADRVAQVDLAVLVDRVDPVGRADQGTADLRGQDLLDREDLDPADRVDRDLVGLVGRDPGDQVGRADLRTVGPGDRDLVARVDRADPHRRRTRPEAPTIGAARKWGDPGMRRTASARPVTVRRLRPHNTDGVGMAALHLARRRLSGTDRRPRAAGTVHRLPEAGTPPGMGRRAISVPRSAISGRSITTDTTPSRCSTRFSGDGASGSSESGFRCTDTTSQLVASG